MESSSGKRSNEITSEVDFGARNLSGYATNRALGLMPFSLVRRLFGTVTRHEHIHEPHVRFLS